MERVYIAFICHFTDAPTPTEMVYGMLMGVNILLMCERKERMSNDLISHEYLKKNWIGIDTPVGYRKVVDLEVIDNAPIVSTYTFEEVEEIRQATISLVRNSCKNKRPQGEWIVLLDDNNIQTCKCSICGRMVDIAGREFDKFPYCHCGADMRKEAENE